MTLFFRRPAGPVLAAALLAAGTLPAMAAESSGGGTSRGDVAQLSGQYILLDPLWIPIVDTANDRTFNGGILVRLEPDPARKVDACYAVPDVVDALVVDFYENRLTRSEQKRPGFVAKRVQAVVDREVGTGLFGMPQVFGQVPELDEESIKLSRACQ
jgi:hypothetical protein